MGEVIDFDRPAAVVKSGNGAREVIIAYIDTSDMPTLLNSEGMAEHMLAWLRAHGFKVVPVGPLDR